MAELPNAFDLGPVMRALKRRHEKSAKAAGDALQSYKDARSCLHDLQYTKELLNFCVSLKLGTPQSTPLIPSVLGAILNNAILFYVRATQPGPNRNNDARRHLEITKYLDDNEKKLHSEMATLRNKAVAHLDQSRPIDGKTFADENIILVHHPDGGHKIWLADRRISVQLDLQQRFIDLVDKAIVIAVDIIAKKDLSIAKHLYEISLQDNGIGQMIEAYPFDSVKFFGDEEAARNFLMLGAPHIEPVLDKAFFSDWPDPPASDKI